jgi:Uma2 family endonuclease
MATISEIRLQPEQRIVLQGISWSLYESLLTELGDHTHTRLAYDRGALEMMSPSRDHDRFSRILCRMIWIVTEELDIETQSLGSTTWRSQVLQRGVEADECFYIQHEAIVRTRKEIDLSIDPPPDLAVEVEISHSIVDRLGIWSALGVPEIWRYDGHRLRVFALNADRQYAEAPQSLALPMVSITDLERFIERADGIGETEWSRLFRAWVRENLKGDKS